MYLNKTIAIIVPCYNEESQIQNVLAGMPEWVDRIYVVDDASPDSTALIVTEYAQKDPRVILIRHDKNSGIGGTLATGYQRCQEDKMDIAVVMAGDGQMDPLDLPQVISPVANGLADYVKGNRFLYPGGIKRIPRVRLTGNFILSALTKISSGYWHISDTQSGYTAMSLAAMQAIPLEKIYRSYGCPNDILTKLNIAGARVAEVPVNPLYNVGEKSKMKVPRVAIPILFLLFRNFIQRLVQRYMIRTAHPLVLAYFVAMFGFTVAVELAVYIVFKTMITREIPKTALIAFGFDLVISLQLLITAFEMDYNDNQRLQITLNGPLAPLK